MSASKRPSRRPPVAARRSRRGVMAWMAILGLAGSVTLAYVSMTGKPEVTQTAPVAVAPSRAPVHGFEIVREYPHDRDAFTQGLVFRDGFLYESTGQYGQSTLRKVDLATGRVVQQQRVPAQHFAEGLVDWKDRLIQLTWQTNTGFVYRLDTFELATTFSYPGEGWGLTHDGTRLIMSDGTAQLRFLDPETRRELSRIRVLDGNVPIEQLNELEYVDGQVYANVWGSDRVAVIDPATGRVVSWIDFTGLLRASARRGTEDVLNGIAYDAAARRLFVTGKLWPTLFEVRVRRNDR